MKFKIGDLVREDAEYVRRNEYANGRYNQKMIRLGHQRKKVVAVNEVDKTVTVCHPKVEPSRAAQWTVPEEQLMLFPDNPELEQAYQETVEKYKPQIAECLRMAEAAISEAERIADTHGVPFHGASGIAQTYTPKNLPNLDLSVINEITGTWVEDVNDQGWQHSAVC